MFRYILILLPVALIFSQTRIYADQDFFELHRLYMLDVIRDRYGPIEPQSTEPLKSDEIEPIQVTFEPLRKSVLSALVTSPVKKIHKYLGESFKKNDILMELDSMVYRASVEKSKAALAKAKTGLYSKEQLYKDGIASLFDVKDAEAAVAQYNAELALAVKLYSSCTIRAPFDGKVASIFIAEYELPQINQPLIEIVGDDVILGKMLIDGANWNKIFIGQTLNVQVNETGQAIKARVIRIGPIIDLASSTLKVETEIENRNDELIGGMTGTTNFISESDDVNVHKENKLSIH